MPKYVSSDGREFTDYNAACILNEMMQKRYNVQNSHDYRYFLQKNAEVVMKDFASCAGQRDKDMVLCPVCKSSLEYKPNGTMN